MTDWATLLSDIRDELQDASATPRWSDKQLYLYTKDAIRDYSTWFPKRVDDLELTITDGRAQLPTDFVDDIQVEYPLDTVLVKRRDRPGAVYRTGSPVVSYFIQGGNLYLPGAAGKAYLTYFATHDVPTSEQDSDFALTVPDVDIEMIVLYVMAKVYGHIRARQSALDRFKPVGKRDDNPLTPETDNLYERYLQMVVQRTTGGVVILYKLNRSLRGR